MTEYLAAFGMWAGMLFILLVLAMLYDAWQWRREMRKELKKWARRHDR